MKAGVRFRARGRPTLGSAFALLFLLWGAGGAFGVSNCPHHDAARADRVGAAPAHSGHGSAAHPIPEEPAPHSPCTCLGTCQGSTGAHPAAGAGDLRVRAPGTARSIPLPPDLGLARLLPFSQPYANAPPASA